MTYFPDTAGTGLSIAAFPDAGALALTDKDTITRGGLDYLAPVSALATLARRTPAGSRTAALPVTLTAADHDCNVVLTGSGGAVSVDATVTDGFRCHLLNVASSGVTFANLQPLPATWSTLAAGASATVMVIGSVAYAALSSGYGSFGAQPGGSGANALPIDAATFAGVF